MHTLSLLEGRRMTIKLFHNQTPWKYGNGPGSNSRPLDLQSDPHLLSDTLPTALRGPVILFAMKATKVHKQKREQTTKVVTGGKRANNSYSQWEDKVNIKHKYIWHIVIFKWEATFDFQQCGILKSVDSDEPLQPLFFLSLETPNDVQSEA